MTDHQRPPSSLPELLAALRAPALPSELEGQNEVVDHMAAVITPPAQLKESNRMSPLSRIPRAAVVAAVAVLGLGGVAAAATGTNPLSPVLTDEPSVSPTTETPTTVVETTSTLDESTSDVTPPPAEGVEGEVVCPEDVANHGEAVSQVAKDHSVTGAEHGEAVSEMAKSDCGKTDEEAVEPLDASLESAEEPTEVECPEGVANHGEAVSQVAKDRSVTGRDHGKAVSEMAKSDCGKTED
jgi:hypothetical protein